MAEEIKKVVSVDVSKAVEDVEKLSESLEGMDDDILSSIKLFKDYKTAIDTMSVSLSKMEEGTDEYDKTLSDLTTVQNGYAKALELSKTKTDAAAGSYNALSKEMSELKKKWKETNDETERKSIGDRIYEINSQLKDLDSSIGNYQRNVGNYASAFTGGLEQLGEKFKALNNPMALAKKGVMALKGAFDALKANFIGAIIAALVVTIKALVSAFKNNEEATNKLKKAFSSFEPIINLVKKGLGFLVNVIGDVLIYVSKLVDGVQNAGVKIAEWLNKVGLVSDTKLKSIKENIQAQKDAVETSRKLTEDEIALEDRKRKEQVETAKKEAEISELKAKAVETDKYTAKERQEMLEKSIQLEKEINNERLAIAQLEYDIAKKRSEQTPNSKEDNDKLAEAQANYFNVKREYTERIKELNSQLVSSSKEVASQLVEETDYLGIASEEITKAIEEMDSELDSSISKSMDESIKKEEEFEKIRNRVNDAEKNPYELKLEQLQEQYDAELALYQEFGEDSTLLTEQYEAQRADIITQYEEEVAEKKKKAWEEEKQKKIEELEEAEQKRHEYAVLADDISTILGSIGDGWQALLDQQYKTGKLSEKEYKRRQKAMQAFQISSVIGSSAAAIFDLWSGYAKEVGVINTEGSAPYGIAAPVVKAGLDAKSLISVIAKTATIASTAATQIASIRSASSSSSVSSSSSSSASASLSSSATSSAPSYTQTVMGQTDIDNLQNAVSTGTSEGQQNVKVYVVASEITEKQDEIKTIVSESSF